MSNIRVSVVVPVYNLESLIAETLQSLKAQTFKDFEAIVVDDGSTDGSAKAIEQFLDDMRFKYVYKKNAGLGAARNTALEMCSGEWFAQLDGDDLWLPDKLELQLAIADTNPEANLIYGNIIVFRGDGQEYTLYKESDLREGDITDWLYTTNRLPGLSVMVKTDDLRAIGGYAEERLCEDYDTWLRLAHRGIRAAVCRKPVAKYRVRAGSLVSDVLPNLQRQMQILENALEREKRPHLARIIKSGLAVLRSRIAFEIARQAAKIGNQKDVEINLWRAWQYQPKQLKLGIKAIMCTLSRITHVDLGRNDVLAKLKSTYNEWEIEQQNEG